MKRFLILFSFLIAFVLGAMAQPHSAILGVTAGTDTTKGAVADTITLPFILPQEYDYSYQIIPTACGAGDSVSATITLWQANDYDGTAFTEITSARDTITALLTSGQLIEGTNATGARHRLIVTGVSTDTVKYKVYWILKLDRQF
jgi:hypothetical protein